MACFNWKHGHSFASHAMRSILPDGLGPGARVGSWIVDAQLAAGGSGTVYRAHHVRTRQRAAVKVLHAELAGSREAGAWFSREVRATQRARHPGLARVYGAGALPDGRPWFATELLEGRDLATIIMDRGAFSPVETGELFVPLCAALAAAHRNELVHRDVKASNVFVAESERGPRIVLLDFGVAKLLDPTDASLAGASRAIRTPSSMAPEQTAGGSIDARTDIYGLGVLAFQLLTGELPFADASLAIMRQLHRWARRPSPSSRAQVSPELDAVVIRAMARDPAQRHQSVASFLADLRAAITSGLYREPVPPPGHVRATLAVHIEVRNGDGSLDDADAALLDEFEALLPRAVAQMVQNGYLSAVEMGNAAVMVKPCASAAPTRAERREALDLARTVWKRLGTDEGSAQTAERAPRLRLYLDVRSAELAGQRIVGGPVMRLADWIPDDDSPGVHGSARALADLEPGAGES